MEAVTFFAQYVGILSVRWLAGCQPSLSKGYLNSLTSFCPTFLSLPPPPSPSLSLSLSLLEKLMGRDKRFFFLKKKYIYIYWVLVIFYIWIFL